MATVVGTLTPSASKTSGTGLASSGSLTVDVGDIVVTALAVDNNVTNMSAAKTGGTCTVGSWTVYSHTTGGSAAAGAQFGLAWAPVTGAGTLTAVAWSWTTSVAAKAVGVVVYRGLDTTGPRAGPGSTANGTTARKIIWENPSSTDIQSGDTVIYGVAVEADAGGSKGSGWLAPLGDIAEVFNVATSGGGAASNMRLQLIDVLSSPAGDGTGDYGTDDSVSRDFAGLAVAFPPASTGPTLTPSGLSHTRAQGSPVVSPSLGPAGQVHTRALGSPTTNPTLSVASIQHTRAIGSPTVSVATSLSPASLSHTRALGTPTVSPQVVTTSLTHTRGIGSITISSKIFVNSLEHTRGIGSVTISTAVTLSPTGLSHTRALGTPAVSPTIGLAGLAHTRTLGAITLHPTLRTVSLEHTRALGSPTVSQAAQTSPGGLEHTRVIGSPAISPSLGPAGLVRTRTIGTFVVHPGLAPSGLVHTRALGSPVVAATTLLSPGGLLHTRALGTPLTNSSPFPLGLIRFRELGSSRLSPGLIPSGIVHERALGLPTTTTPGGGGPTADHSWEKVPTHH